ncbi:replicative DNA helicase [bacterium]|nr:replicative DNA helicase [bacterium]MCB1220017.1 replicative DNA helicase [bacterium]UNM08676.1 MAG: replicative DNA helicase [Planctomycetales bacterium]
MAVYRDDNIQEHVHDRTPPQNVDLEMCVLGAIMLEPKEAFPLAQDYLNRDSFYLDGHGIIFELMGELFNRGIPPDSVAVLDELRSRGQMERVGGSAVVMGMLNSVPTAANVEYHARKVAEKGHLRKLIRTCTEIVDECYRQELSLEQVVDRAESGILKMSTNTGRNRMDSISEVLREYWEKLSTRDEELRQRRNAGEPNPKISAGLPTGFRDLDQMIGGLRESELLILAARPSMGKSALALNFMHNVSVLNSIPTAIFSLEMGADQMAERLMTQGTMYTRHNRIQGVSSGRLQNPDLSDLEWNVLTQSYNKLVSAPIYIDDSSVLTIGMLKSKARRLYTQYGIRCIIVDYLQLMSGPNSGGDNRVQEVSEISRGLKQIARELRIPVIALSQLSRQVESRTSKKPQLSDLRESGAIEQDADIVMFIHREDYYQEKTQDFSVDADYDRHTLPDADLIVAKNRNGPTGLVKMRFFKEITRFLEPM